MTKQYPLPFPTGTTIKVFHDSPLFDKWRWWEFDSRKLYIATYTLAADDRGDYDGNWEADCKFLLEQHPGCVFVY